MHELLPFSAYDDPGDWATLRITAVMALLWGVPLALVLWFTGGRAGPLGIFLLVGIATGLVFGFFWSRSFRRMMIAMSRRLHDGDPELVPPPPPGDYQFRVMGTLIRAPIGVGGHLYAGPARWVFVPHRKNRRGQQDPIELPPAPVEVVTVPQTWLAKIFTARTPLLVRIADAGGAFLLKVPRPVDVASRLSEIARS